MLSEIPRQDSFGNHLPRAGLWPSMLLLLLLAIASIATVLGGMTLLVEQNAFWGSPAGCSEPLYSSDRQGFVIMMDKIPDRSDMIFNFF